MITCTKCREEIIGEPVIVAGNNYHSHCAISVIEDKIEKQDRVPELEQEITFATGQQNLLINEIAGYKIQFNKCINEIISLGGKIADCQSEIDNASSKIDKLKFELGNLKPEA